MFRTVPLSIIRSFFTVHTAVVYVSKGQKDLMIEMQGKQKVIRGSNASLSSKLHKISKVKI